MMPRQMMQVQMHLQTFLSLDHFLPDGISPPSRQEPSPPTPAEKNQKHTNVTFVELQRPSLKISKIIKWLNTVKRNHFVIFVESPFGIRRI